MDKIVCQIPIIQESVVELWESIPRDWPNKKYDTELVEEIDKLLKKYSIEFNTQIKKILDCGCGTGNPSLGLASKGYNIFCVDSDPHMVEHFKNNCKEVNLEIPVITSDWRDLNGELLKKGPFDAAICRGNSLIYAGCWERDALLPQVAEKAIKSSLNNIAKVLKKGGLFYVDLTSRKEYQDTNQKFEFVGLRETNIHNILIYWINDYEPKTRTRHVHAHRIFESKLSRQIEKITQYTFTGYMLYHDELKLYADEAGLDLVETYPEIKSEWLYDVFIFKRR